ncbi:hypothetical protein HKBW3C_02230, partial [Candidatus Hakubella thermalkaliphila]
VKKLTWESRLAAMAYRDVGQLNLLEVVPLVFQVAAEGDMVALDILKNVGEELALCANILIRQLFEPEEEVRVVLGGGILREAPEILLSTLRRKLLLERPQVCLVIPKLEPAVGALFFCFEEMGIPLDQFLIRRLESSWQRLKEKNCGLGPKF